MKKVFYLALATVALAWGWLSPGEIVRTHGGGIEARNASSGGAKFIAKLPANPS